jgi:hypothetical protein
MSNSDANGNFNSNFNQLSMLRFNKMQEGGKILTIPTIEWPKLWDDKGFG